MEILVVNLTLFILLTWSYVLVKKQLQKSIMFDVSILYLLKYTIFPVIVAVVNSIVLYIFFINWITLAVIPLAIPLIRGVIKGIKTFFDKNEYKSLEKIVVPIVLSEFKQKGFIIDIAQISIRPKQAKKLDIVVNIKEENKWVDIIEKSIENKIRLNLQSKGYLVQVILKSPYKKKENKPFIPSIV